jgi:hypothetical protein
VSIFDRKRVAVLAGCAMAMVSLVRCAPTSSCLRISDCDVGMTCVSGTCAPAAAGVDLEASVLEGSAAEASVATATDATTGTDTSKSGDAAGGDAEGDDGSTIGDAADDGYIDTADF